jgi:YbbR domain-containing protein
VKTKWIYQVFKYLKKVYFRNDKRVAAYLVCVAIATGFWFLNALSKTYTEDIIVPVSYINFPNNKTIASKPADRFEMKVRAHGFTILRNKLSFLFMPLEFNVNELTKDRMQISKKSSFAIPSRQFYTELSYQLSNELDILSISPDTLYFKFDQMGTKRVKICPVVKLNLKKQFQISGNIETKPDSVTINGAQSTIDTLQCVYTETLRGNSVDQAFTKDIKIRPVKEVYFDRKSVEITVPVEEYTEAQQMVQVGIIDKPIGRNIKLFPAKVSISYQIGLSRFAQIHPEDFKLTVSYKDILEGKPRLKISVDSTPAYIYSLKIKPEELEYLIESSLIP